MVELLRTFIVNILSICQVVVCLCALSGTGVKKKYFSMDFFLQHFEKKRLILCLWTFWDYIIFSNYNLDVFFWCRILRFIMLVPNCPGAKLSGAKLSWSQIVRVPNCPVPNCPVPNCPTIKIRYHIFHFKHIHPQNEKQKKTIFHFNENSNRFQS